LVIYTSTNGFFIGEHGMMDKRFMYEESIKTPLHMQNSQIIAGENVVCDKMVLNIDLAPTILELAELDAPSGLQGKSMVPLMTGSDQEIHPEGMYYHYYDYPGWHDVRKHYGIRTKDMKLMRFYGDDVDEYEMYDLSKDPQEKDNVFNYPNYAQQRTDMLANL